MGKAISLIPNASCDKDSSMMEAGDARSVAKRAILALENSYPRVESSRLAVGLM